jgi:hypothetical protein
MPKCSLKLFINRNRVYSSITLLVITCKRFLTSLHRVTKESGSSLPYWFDLYHMIENRVCILSHQLNRICFPVDRRLLRPSSARIQVFGAHEHVFRADIVLAMTIHTRKREECRKAGNKLDHWKIVMRPAFLYSSSATGQRCHCEAFDCPKCGFLIGKRFANGREKAAAISFSSGASKTKTNLVGKYH